MLKKSLERWPRAERKKKTRRDNRKKVLNEFVPSLSSYRNHSLIIGKPEKSTVCVCVIFHKSPCTAIALQCPFSDTGYIKLLTLKSHAPLLK